MREPPQSASSGGTRDSCGRLSRYQSVAPAVIAPTASVTISALSLRIADQEAVDQADQRRRRRARRRSPITRSSSRPPETPSRIVLDSVMIAGIDRSMPRDISTSASPIAVMARKAASGMTARIVDGQQAARHDDRRRRRAARPAPARSRRSASGCRPRPACAAAARVLPAPTATGSLALVMRDRRRRRAQPA